MGTHRQPRDDKLKREQHRKPERALHDADVAREQTTRERGAHRDTDDPVERAPFGHRALTRDAHEKQQRQIAGEANYDCLFRRRTSC